MQATCFLGGKQCAIDRVCLGDAADLALEEEAVIAETEKQVVGRCYRPPQDREVRVHRFLIEDSIESKVYDSTLRHIDLKAIWEQRTT